MKTTYTTMVLACLLAACNNTATNEATVSTAHELVGTWQLLSGTTIQGSDTTYTAYTQGQEMIKIISPSHFAFMRHDLENGEGDSPVYFAGGGRCKIEGNSYTEYLDYFNERAWEGSHFEFEFEIRKDTLVTQGRERVEELGIDYLNIEKYVRIAPGTSEQNSQ